MPKKISGKIVCAYAEYYNGGDFKNTPVYFFWQDKFGYKQEIIHPQHQTEEMRILYLISAVVNKAMVEAVEKYLKQKQ